MESLSEYVRVVLHRSEAWMSLAGSALSLGCSALSSAGILPVATNLTPLFLWGGVALFVLAQFFAFHEMRKERDAYKGPTFDMSHAELLQHVLGDNRHPEWVTDLYREIRQEAVLGRLSVWARRYQNLGLGEGEPLLPVEKEYWLHWQLDLLETYRNEGSIKSERADLFQGNGDVRHDFHYSRKQVEARWPRKRAKLRWQLPFKVERKDTPKSPA